MPVLNQPLNDGYYVAKASVLKASETIPYGNVAMMVGGKIRAALTAVANSTLLGMSMQNLAETTGADVTLSQPAVFIRGQVVYLNGKAGDLPTAVLLGSPVALDTSSSVKATIAANDLTLILVDVRADGMFGVRIP